MLFHRTIEVDVFLCSPCHLYVPPIWVLFHLGPELYFLKGGSHVDSNDKALPYIIRYHIHLHRISWEPFQHYAVAPIKPPPCSHGFFNSGPQDYSKFLWGIGVFHFSRPARLCVEDSHTTLHHL